MSSGGDKERWASGVPLQMPPPSPLLFTCVEGCTSAGLYSLLVCGIELFISSCYDPMSSTGGDDKNENVQSNCWWSLVELTH